MEPKIIFEDKFLLVIDKPSGMVVNRADTTAKIETVQDWVERNVILSKAKDPQRDSSASGPRMTASGDFDDRSGTVHRLDKETSGLLLIAKTPEVFLNLQAQFKNRQVKKKYLALVHGKVVPEEGEIKAPVGRLPWNRQRFGIIPGGREAVTRYKTLRYYDKTQSEIASSPSAKKILSMKKEGERGGFCRARNESFVPHASAKPDLSEQTRYTFLELYPQTGRTHQIRVHMQFIGHPVVGDSLYAGRKQAQEDRKFCPRVFLHASYIEFIHPESNKLMQFNSPLPEDLGNILKQFI